MCAPETVSRRLWGPSIGLLSAALIGCQFVWMHGLADVQWSHFAHMIIAVGMLGFGASGTALALASTCLVRRVDTAAPLFMATASLLLALALVLARLEWVRFDMLELFMGQGHRGKLALTYLVFFLPVFCGALPIGLILAARPSSAGSLYAWNLAGSAAGGPLALLLLLGLTSAQAASFLAAIGLAGAFAAGLARVSRAASAVTTAALVLLIFFPPGLEMSVYKDLRRALDLPDTHLAGPFPNPMGTVHTVHAPALRYAPSLSLEFRGEPPRGRHLYVNGHGYGVLLPPPAPGENHILDYTPRGLPYALRTPESVLILGAGGGESVTHAQWQGASGITAVEPHPGVLTLSADNSMLFPGAEGLSWSARSPRSYLQLHKRHREHARYDLMVLPTIGEFGGDSGLRAMEENFLFTREALRLMDDRLGDHGMIGAAAWIDYPPRNPLRLASLMADLAREWSPENPGRHLIAVSNWGVIQFVLTRQPLSDREMQSLRKFSDRLGFDQLLPPDGQEPAHQLEDDTFRDLLRAIASNKPSPDLDSYPFALDPPTDQRPYFQLFLRWGHWNTYRQWFFHEASPFLEVGFPLLVLTFFQIALLSAPLLFLPMLRRAALRGGWVRPLLYFGGVGAGFMFWQMIMIQRFTLYWDHPLFAASGVISTLLLGMGLGSLLSSRLEPQPGNRLRVTAAIAALLFLYALLLPPMMHLSLGLDLALRLLIGIALLLPPAILMGMPFPLGLRWVQDPSGARVGWVWGIDGYASVVCATGAVLLAALLGFIPVLLLAALAYAAAATASTK